MYYESDNYLAHYGIKGMKWGRRRFRNYDDTLTNAGKTRYAKENYKQAKKQWDKDYDSMYKAARKTKTFAVTKRGKAKKNMLASDYNKKYDKAMDSLDAMQKAKTEYKQAKKADKMVKKYAKKGYAQDAYNGNKSALGKAYDKVTGAHKINADITYANSSHKENVARAQKYLAGEASKQAHKESYKKAVKERAAQINKGASTVGRLYNNLTGAHKIQAEIELDIERRGRSNRNRRD